MSLSFWIRDFIFLPLATLRRELWWRNLALVIAMFIFGIWHKGSFLLMMWGVYHGVLLVLHRQWQGFRQRIGLDWSGAVATAISWLLTFSAVCVGYIFFRSESLSQAFHLLRAIASPASYCQPTLDPAFYVMAFTAAAGYFAVIAGGGLLDRLADFARKRSEKKPGLLPHMLGILADERWVWITPVVLVLMLYFSVIFQPGRAETGPVMYALF